MRPTINALLQTLALVATAAWAAPAYETSQQLSSARRSSTDSGIQPSYNISSCPGYKLIGEPREAASGFTANLSLAGKACNAYGVDIHNLTLAVVYEKPEQLHVHIYDTAKNQYQLPSGLVFDRPGDDPSEKDFSTADDSHLQFHHTGADISPWAFWITRKSSGQVIFDTRQENIPTYDSPLNTTETRRNTTAMPAHPIVFENQYLQLSSALPENAYIYGLGEYISAGFRRDSNHTIQPFFTLDAGDPVDSNMYGYHPVYLEARQNGSDVQTHSVYYQNTAGMDVILRSGVIQYRAIGGTLDFRFFSGDESSSSSSKRAAIEAPEARASSSSSSTANSALKAISQYVSFIGTPVMVPRWALGFHLCRWGYKSANETLEVAKEMRKHDIPLEVQWNDIDYMNEFRDWTIAPDNYSQSDYSALISYLHEHKQHYIPIVDAAIATYPPKSDDEYYLTTTGAELDTFLKNANGTIYEGQVWPGTARFPAWNAPNTQKWWTESVKNFSSLVDFDGIWLDMNEPSSFCVGSCGSGGNHIANYAVPASVGGWPEGYDNQTYGNSGNLIVDGSYTFKKGHQTEILSSKRSEVRADQLTKKASDVKIPHYNYQNETQRYVNVPPYAIHSGINNGVFDLATNLDMKTAAMDSLTDGVQFYDLHNVFGTLEEKATYNALLDLRPKDRPFLISRSTYPGAGKYSHHWLGDNYSLWSYAYRSLQGILQFQIYGIPMVGPDCVGFARNTDEELANRWQQMCAMVNPFFRNHNRAARSQEPFRWPSVAKASRKANYKRLELLPYYYSTMARASQYGTPAVRPLWYDFPSTFADTGATDSQVLFGPSLLVTPVLEPNVTSVKGYFPSAGGKWRNVFTYEALDVPANKNVSIPAELGNINAHVRPGAALLTHAEPKYTTVESAEGPYGLLVNLNDQGKAEGDFYLDDGHTMNADSTDLTVSVGSGSLKSSASGKYDIPQKLSSVLLLGVESKPGSVKLDGDAVKAFKYDGGKQMLNVTLSSGADLNKDFTLTWA